MYKIIAAMKGGWSLGTWIFVCKILAFDKVESGHIRMGHMLMAVDFAILIVANLCSSVRACACM